MSIDSSLIAIRTAHIAKRETAGDMTAFTALYSPAKGGLAINNTAALQPYQYATDSAWQQAF